MSIAATQPAELPRGAAVEQGPAAGPRATVWFQAAALVVLTCAVYASSLGGGFLWDDDDHFHGNAAVQSPAGLADLWFTPGATMHYFPVTSTAFWLEVRLWGNWPPGFRGVNLALHVIDSLLVWLLLRRLGVAGSSVVALIFALHPVQVQSVAWITELKNLLGFFFYLLAMAAWWRQAPPEGDARGDGRRWGWYVLAIVLFTAAVLAKANMVVWIGGVVLVRWWKSGRLRAADLVPLIPFVVIGLSLAALSVVFERVVNRSVGEDWALAPLERCLLAGRSAWFYAGKMLWPAPLIFFYPMWHPDRGDWRHYVPLVTALALPLVLWALRGRIGRGPLAAVLLFGGTVLPALGLVNIYGHRYSQVYDYMQYPANLGLILLVVSCVATALDRCAAPRFVGVGLTVAVVAILGMLTHARSLVYRDQETLWRDTVRQNPEAWSAQTNLGLMLLDRGNDAEALPFVTRARELNPRAPEAQHNEAVVLERLGSLEQAIEGYRRAVALDPTRVDFRYDLGVALALAGSEAEARREIGAALGAEPDSLAVSQRIAQELIAAGRSAAGTAVLRAAISAPPVDAAVPWPMLWLLAWELATTPDDAVRDGVEAAKVARRGLEITGGRSPQLLDALAAAEAEQGNFATAQATADRAVAIAGAAGLDNVVRDMAPRRAAYAAGKPWRQPDRPTHQGEAGSAANAASRAKN